MKRLILVVAVGAVAAGLVFAGGVSEKARAMEPKTVTFWYHLDNPQANPDALVAKFERENPGIKIALERQVWGTFHQKLVTAIAGGTPPDVTTGKLWWQPQLVELGALAPVDSYVTSWPGRTDVFDNVWRLSKHSDGKQYYMPLQMVILYLYYRVDMFRDLGLKVPTTREEFLDAAKRLTRDTNGDGQVDVWGFGIRGARGGHDFWGTFVLSSGAQFFDGTGRSGLTTPEAIAANQWFIDLFRVHKISPPTTPTDGFREIIANMRSGKTAMTIHHIGSSKGMTEALGDKISAAPVPRGTRGSWTSFGDEQTALMSASKVKDEAFKWMAFLATAPNNEMWNQASGQVSINISNGQTREAQDNRFLKATIESAPFAGVLPAHPRVAEFVESVWPTHMQRALNGEISSEQMLRAFEEHFGKR